MIPNKKIFPWDKKWKFGVCSRNFQLIKPDNSSYWTLAKELEIERKMTVWCDDHNMGLIIQGEAVGIGIQGNKYKFNDVRLFVFNIATYDKGKRDYFNQGNQEFLCGSMGLTPVPWLTAHFKLKPTVPEMVEYAKGYSLLNKETPREGIVVRNYPNNVSFKIVSTDFLLKYDS
jgi:ATP-dependent RNA circularization protein (DNA/RNA ligase family)